MVKTLCCRCRGCGFHPWSGNEDPICCTGQPNRQKFKKICCMQFKKKLIVIVHSIRGFPGDSVVKNPPADSGDARHTGLVPGPGRSHVPWNN